MAGERAVRVRVTGRVQGVAYRAWTLAEADRRGVAGWVRNERDGSVAALLVGPAERISAMVEAMRRGPPGAAVSGVTWEPEDAGDRPAGFEIRR